MTGYLMKSVADWVPQFKGSSHKCEASGCSVRIPSELQLRFCGPCRLLQPIPTRNKHKNEKYNQTAKAKRNAAREAALLEAEDYRRTYE